MVSPGLALAASGAGGLSVIVATMFGGFTGGCGAGSGIGPLTNRSSAADLLTWPVTEPRCLPSFATGFPVLRGAAMAAMGVIKIVKESRQATNTLGVPGTGSEDDFFTVIDS